MQNILSKIATLLKIGSRIEKIHYESRFTNRVNLLNDSVVNSKSPGTTNVKYGGVETIVSLTTYGKRLYDVYLTIESIMQQSRKPNKIVLWLDERLAKQEMPMTLQLQTERGLEIRFCKDIRSYTKLIPSLKAFPDAVVITIDDDLIYDIDFLDKLIMAYLSDSSYIYYNRGHKMKLTSSKKLDKYLNWEWNSESMDVSSLNFPTGVGGVLYPPNIFSQEVFNEEVFLSICPTADDVWFKAMSLMNGKACRKVYTRKLNGEEYIENEDVQDIALFKINNGQSQNDIQIKKVFDKYNLYQTLID